MNKFERYTLKNINRIGNRNTFNIIGLCTRCDAKVDFKQPKKEYSPYPEDHYPQNVYFGDTHLHTLSKEAR